MSRKVLPAKCPSRKDGDTRGDDTAELSSLTIGQCNERMQVRRMRQKGATLRSTYHNHYSPQLWQRQRRRR